MRGQRRHTQRRGRLAGRAGIHDSRAHREKALCGVCQNYLRRLTITLTDIFHAIAWTHKVIPETQIDEPPRERESLHEAK